MKNPPLRTRTSRPRPARLAVRTNLRAGDLQGIVGSIADKVDGMIQSINDKISHAIG
jgi:hypothetical protein